MPIELVWGTGEGATPLSAFDAALANGGIHNYNLVTLSSVIPPDTAVNVSGSHDRAWPVGSCVGTVLSKHTSTVTGETIAAGLGWAQANEGGVFFESSAESAANVEERLTRGIDTAQSIRDEWTWDGGIETKIVDHTVDDTGAAIVAALYHPLDE